VLAIEKTSVKAGGRGTVVDVAEVGATIERGAPVLRYREHSAAVARARAKLAALQRKFEGSEEHEDFIAQARQNVRAAQNRRKVRPIVAPVRGTIVRVAVKEGDELARKKVVVDLAVARITVPGAAVDGEGKRCKTELAGKPVEGTLLAIGVDERTLELDGVPPDVEPGDIGEIRIRCTDE
jgi:biotin carboxyl carrier protein